MKISELREIVVLLLSKAIKKSHISSIRRCQIHRTSKVMASSLLYDTYVDRYTYLGYGCRVVNCSIGAFCSISDDVNIGGGGHPLDHVSTSPVFHMGNNVLKKVFYPHDYIPTKKTSVGNDVWIGYGAIIKAGVNIGTGAVVGTGSVVTKDIPAYEIWAGSPAKLIRPRFNDEVVEKLLSTKWWEMPDEWLYENAELFSDVEKFIEKNK